MSGQYLEAHAFLKTLRDKGVPYTETLLNLMQYAVIEEVAPVVHAYWIERNDKSYLEGLFECSNCSEFNGWRATYCPDCGAGMDGKEV